MNFHLFGQIGAPKKSEPQCYPDKILQNMSGHKWLAAISVPHLYSGVLRNRVKYGSFKRLKEKQVRCTATTRELPSIIEPNTTRPLLSRYYFLLASEMWLVFSLSMPRDSLISLGVPRQKPLQRSTIFYEMSLLCAPCPLSLL